MRISDYGKYNLPRKMDRFKDLEKAYPNYFVDTEDFIVELEKIIKKSN